MNTLRLAGAALALAAAAAAQQMPVARQLGSGQYELWTVQSGTGATARALDAFQFLPVELEGYALKDRFKTSLPTPMEASGGIQGIRLPDGGRLHRIARGGATEILRVDGEGAVSIAFSRPDAQGVASVLPGLSVSRDGSRAIVATALSAGGEVYLLDLTGLAPPALLTAAGAGLDVDEISLRVSQTTAWFFADDALFRADLVAGTPAAPVALPIGVDDEVLPELALAAGGEHVAVVTVDDDDLRDIHLVARTGAATTVTDAPGEYLAPGYDDPLGPWLEVAPSGVRVAFVDGAEGQSEELYVKEVGGGPALHVTADPEFPVYLDNIGPLIFILDVSLCFFAGDTQLSQTGAEQVGAGEMYMADFSQPTVEYCNVSLTNGQNDPPFTQPGTLEFAEAAVDPGGTRFLLWGESENDDNELTTFAVSGPPATQVLLSGLDDDPVLLAAGPKVLVVTNDENTGAQLHAVEPAGSGAPALTALFTAPGSSQLDRFAVDPAGTFAAFVLVDEDGYERPHAVDLGAAKVFPVVAAGSIGASPPPVSSHLGISADLELFCGYGLSNGAFKLWRHRLPQSASNTVNAFGANSGLRLRIPASADFAPLLR